MIYHNGLSLSNALPLEEVFSDPFVDHVLEDVTTATSARSYSLLRLLLDLFAHSFDGRLTVLFKRLLHHNKLLLFLALAHSIKTHFQQRVITVLFEAKHSLVGMHHEFLVFISLTPGFDEGSQSVKSLASHFIQVIPESAKCDSLELVLGKCPS